MIYVKRYKANTNNERFRLRKVLFFMRKSLNLFMINYIFPRTKKLAISYFS